MKVLALILLTVFSFSSSSSGQYSEEVNGWKGEIFFGVPFSISTEMVDGGQVFAFEAKTEGQNPNTGEWEAQMLWEKYFSFPLSEGDSLVFNFSLEKKTGALVIVTLTTRGTRNGQYFGHHYAWYPYKHNITSELDSVQMTWDLHDQLTTEVDIVEKIEFQFFLVKKDSGEVGATVVAHKLSIFKDGEETILDPFDISATGVADEQNPMAFVLEQNYPNPFNPTTTTNYQLSAFGHVVLKVYDVLGREVATIVEEEKAAGSYKVNFDASNLPSGTYIYRLQAGDYVETKKMILLK